MKQNTRWTLLLFLIFIIWGSFYPVSKSVVAGINPLVLAFLRYLFALVPMLPFFILEIRKRKGGVLPALRDIAGISLLGIIGVTGFAVFLFYGISLSSSMLSSLLANTQPVFAVLLAAVLAGESFSRRQFSGILLGIAGMGIVISAGGMGDLGFEKEKILGNILCVLASISISLYYTLMKKHVKKFGSMIPTFISFTAGGIVLLLLIPITGADFSSLASANGRDWLLITYNGVVATAFVYLVHNRAIAVIGVIRTVRLKFLIPVFGVILSMIFLGERSSPGVWTGMAVVIAATIIIQLPEGSGRMENQDQ